MVQWSMRNGSTIGNKLYIQSVFSVLDHLPLFSLCSLSCIAKQVTNQKQLRLLSSPDLLKQTSSTFVLRMISH